MAEEVGEIILRKVRADGLIMSRVPKRIRDNFLKLSEDEFAGDYGMCLKFLWDTYELWCIFLNEQNIKLDYIIKLLTEKDNTQPSAKKMLGGNIIKIKGGKNEQT